jgi:ribosomal protein S6-L-glutamate ligase RimK-like protein
VISSDSFILLWGHASDAQLLAVNQSLQKLGARIAFYDQRRVLNTEVDFFVDDKIRGVLRVDEEELRLEQIRAAYIRPFDSRWLSFIANAGSNSPEWVHAVKIEDALISWAEIAPAFIVNRPQHIASNTSKPYQAACIREVGFEIPKTLVTTDPQAAKEFYETNGDVIYKSVSSQRSVVARLTHERANEMDSISSCPTQFQEWIKGIDYRVHVVGEECFACEILSDAEDYRFTRQNEQVELRSYDLPDDVATLCRRLAVDLNLAVAGIDLRRTEDDRWFCFEANAVAGFAYYQAASNHHIDDAIARMLIERGGG